MNEKTASVGEKGGRRKCIGRLVESRIQRLFCGLETGQTGAKATLGLLRNALYRAPGNRPELWEITSVPTPDDKCVGEDASWEELSVHVALCLYARHQQSQSDPMHQQGVGLGEAVKRLELCAIRKGVIEDENREERKSGARRRLNAAATSVSISELTRHLAGLVSLMRQEKVGLDYRLLAEDLYQFQTPGGPSAVRLRWARQYSKSIKQSD